MALCLTAEKPSDSADLAGGLTGRPGVLWSAGSAQGAPARLSLIREYIMDAVTVAYERFEVAEQLFRRIASEEERYLLGVKALNNVSTAAYLAYAVKKAENAWRSLEDAAALMEGKNVDN